MNTFWIYGMYMSRIHSPWLSQYRHHTQWIMIHLGTLHTADSFKPKWADFKKKRQSIWLNIMWKYFLLFGCIFSGTVTFNSATVQEIIFSPPSIDGFILSPKDNHVDNTYNLTSKANIKISNLTTPCWMEMKLYPLDASVGRLSGNCLGYSAVRNTYFRPGTLINDPIARMLRSILRDINELTIELLHNNFCQPTHNGNSLRPAFKIEYQSKYDYSAIQISKYGILINMNP